jgi:hypothetical protein
VAIQRGRTPVAHILRFDAAQQFLWYIVYSYIKRNVRDGMNQNNDDQLLADADEYNRLVAALNNAMTENRRLGRKIDSSDSYWAALDALRRHTVARSATSLHAQ